MVWDEHPSGGRTGPLGKYILKFSVFVYALPGCPPFLVLVLNFDGSLGFSPVSPIIVPFGTPRASPLRGEACTAPLPTHWQLSHPVFTLSFEAQLMRTPSNCIWFFFLLVVCVCPCGMCVIRWIFAVNRDGSLGFLPGTHPSWFAWRC